MLTAGGWGWYAFGIQWIQEVIMSASVATKEVLESLRAIRRMVDSLERKLSAQEGVEIDPYQRRREVLQKIYWAGNSISREELMPVLESHATDYRWIGQQVKKGYLSVSPIPGGGTRYSVTPKAVKELRLEQETWEEAVAFSRLAEASFAEDWGSEEDAAYDEL